MAEDNTKPMSNLTLEGIAAVIKVELEPVKESLAENTKTLAEHTKTLSAHTQALDQLLTEKKNRDDNKTVHDDRLDYLEKWAKEVSQKFGIEFRP
jgi:hypothetical protein